MLKWRPWAADEDAYLLQQCGSLTNKELAAALEARTPGAVGARVSKLLDGRPRYAPRHCVACGKVFHPQHLRHNSCSERCAASAATPTRSGQGWTAEEDAYLLEHWGRAPAKQLADALGRTYASVCSRQRTLCGPAKLATRECPFCGDVFQTVRSKQIQCGRDECKRAYDLEKSRRLHGIDAGRLQAAQCDYCGESFVPRQTNQRICGDRECRLAYKRDVERKNRDHTQQVQNRRRAENPTIRLNRAFSERVRSSLIEGKAGQSWEATVGYTVENLAAHLEAAFLPGMTWENYGLWHVDHIIPLRAFEYESQDDPGFRAAWSLDNLQPLWARDNHVKSDKTVGGGTARHPKRA